MLSAALEVPAAIILPQPKVQLPIFTPEERRAFARALEFVLSWQPPVSQTAQIDAPTTDATTITEPTLEPTPAMTTPEPTPPLEVENVRYGSIRPRD